MRHYPSRLIFTCVAVVVLLTGCSVPSTGIPGIARGEDGGLSAVVSMCDGHVDGVTIYFNPDEDSGESTTVGDWEYASPVTQAGSVVLSPDPQSLMRQSVDYSVYSWSRDNTSSAYGMQFTLTDLTDLAPGEVLSQDYRENAPPGAVALSAAEFAESVESYCSRN